MAQIAKKLKCKETAKMPAVAQTMRAANSWFSEPVVWNPTAKMSAFSALNFLTSFKVSSNSLTIANVSTFSLPTAASTSVLAAPSEPSPKAASISTSAAATMERPRTVVDMPPGPASAAEATSGPARLRKLSSTAADAPDSGAGSAAALGAAALAAGAHKERPAQRRGARCEVPPWFHAAGRQLAPGPAALRPTGPLRTPAPCTATAARLRRSGGAAAQAAGHMAPARSGAARWWRGSYAM
mmetsp:Transcript_100128/g.254671  ORF Transcript_100128/g.254671 Transcript_100128/m.254671 type:complete len:241 (-) Transcript_100128:31-753(-)